MSLAEEPAGPTRIERARRLIADSHEHARDVGARPQDRLLHVLRDASARRASPRSPAITAQGKATLIRKALEYVRGRYEGRDLAGIVLISDGAATGSFDEDSGDGAVRDFLRSLDTRVHTVWAARDGLKDVAVAKVMADEFAFVRTVVRIEAVIRTTGLPARQVPGDAVDRRPAAAPEARRSARRRSRRHGDVRGHAAARRPLRLRDQRAGRARRGGDDEQHAQLRRPRHPRQDPRAPGRRRSRRGTCARCARCSRATRTSI